MDLTLTEQQDQIAELADRILGEKCPPDALRALERSGGGPARDAWSALARADLLGLALPEAAGGSGLDLVEAAQVARQVGRHVAPVPYWAATAAALTVARWGRDDQRARLLPGAVDGTTVTVPALWQPVEHGDRRRPAVTAVRDGDGYRLQGVKGPVPWASEAGVLLVAAGTDDGARAVFLVESDRDGLTAVDERWITGEPTRTLRFDGVHVPADALLGEDDPGAAVAWLEHRATALLLATLVGVCEEALAITGRYVSEREQFGTPIGTFQAVAHRCADAYIDTEAIRLTTLQALWRLDTDRDADDALDVACFWACEGGQRVVHAAQHLHGGIGVDVDYPIHRYFRWAKGIELLLGGTHSSLLALGARLSAGDDHTSSDSG